MDIRQALKEQYHAGLAMLAECVEKCPQAVWREGQHPRSFWQIAWHSAYFTHLYLGQDESAFNDSAAAWPSAIKSTLGVSEAQKAVDKDPYDLPENITPLTRQDLLDYIVHIRSLVDEMVDGLDLDATETGYSWYPNMNKLSHQLLNVRHNQGHVGQLSELLMAQGIDTSWIRKANESGRL